MGAVENYPQTRRAAQARLPCRQGLLYGLSDHGLQLLFAGIGIAGGQRQLRQCWRFNARGTI